MLVKLAKGTFKQELLIVCIEGGSTKTPDSLNIYMSLTYWSCLQPVDSSKVSKSPFRSQAQGLHAPVEELLLSAGPQITPLKLHVQNTWRGKRLCSQNRPSSTLLLASTAILSWRQGHKNPFYHLTAVFGQSFPSLLFLFQWVLVFLPSKSNLR